MPTEDLSNLTTFDLAFNLATGKYNAEEKMEALAIIKDRDLNKVSKDVGSTNYTKFFPNNTPQPSLNEIKSYNQPTKSKPPLEGSKSKKIHSLLMEGKTVKQVGDELRKQGAKTTPSEIYRVAKNYWPEKYNKK